MGSCNFYYSHLNIAAQKFYLALEEKVCDYQSYPFTVLASLNLKDAGEAYKALYLDKCYIQMAPPHLVSFQYVGANDIVVKLSTQAFHPATSAETARCEEIINEMICENPPGKDSQHRAFLTVIIRRLFERAVYRLDQGGFGESPRDILLFHRGYCTGFARTVKLICNRAEIPCVCVTGALKRQYSALLNPDDVNADIGHMWNALYDGSQWIFFDPTSCISLATRRISVELAGNVYRDFYGNGEFHRPQFFNLPALLKKYTLEEEDLFL